MNDVIKVWGSPWHGKTFSFCGNAYHFKGYVFDLFRDKNEAWHYMERNTMYEVLANIAAQGGVVRSPFESNIEFAQRVKVTFDEPAVHFVPFAG